MNNFIYFSRERLDIVKHDLDVLLSVFFSDNPLEILKKKYECEVTCMTSYSYSDFSLIDDKGECVNDTDAIKLVYENMKNLPAVLASEEIMWAALSLSDKFWPYVRKRWLIDAVKKYCGTYDLPKEQGQLAEFKKWLLDRIFFGKSPLMRHVLARLWWIGRMTYIEGENEDPYRLTNFVMRSEAIVTAIFDRSQGASRIFVKNLCFDLMEREKKDEIKINQNFIRNLLKYVNACGGGVLIDKAADSPDSVALLVDDFLNWYEQK